MELLQTKLYVPPLRPEWVPRPRLGERFKVGLQSKLTLVSAPAGFGKTTMVSEGLRNSQILIGGVSLDEVLQPELAEKISKNENTPVMLIIFGANLASKNGASGRIRTDDRRFTKPLLYP